MANFSSLQRLILNDMGFDTWFMDIKLSRASHVPDNIFEEMAKDLDLNEPELEQIKTDTSNKANVSVDFNAKTITAVAELNEPLITTSVEKTEKNVEEKTLESQSKSIAITQINANNNTKSVTTEIKTVTEKLSAKNRVQKKVLGVLPINGKKLQYSPPESYIVPTKINFVNDDLNSELTIESLNNNIENCKDCNLCKHNEEKNIKPISGTVLGSDSNSNSTLRLAVTEEQKQSIDILVIVGSPTDNGNVLADSNNALLLSIFDALNIDRKTVFVTNIVKCYPQYNRDPFDEESNICHQYIDSQIRLFNPKIIFSIGAVATQSLLSTKAPLHKLLSNLNDLSDLNKTNSTNNYVWEKGNIPIMIMPSLEYLTKVPVEKSKVWQRIKSLKSS